MEKTLKKMHAGAMNPMRRRLMAAGVGSVAAHLLPWQTLAAEATFIEQPFINGRRRLAAYPEKRPLIVLTSRPPQLETPFEVFNDGLMTPNDAFFVRYHNSAIPLSVDGDRHVIKIGGNAAGKSVQLAMTELRSRFKPVEMG